MRKTASEKETKETKELKLPDEEGQLVIDVYQTPEEYVIKSTIAGVNPDDLDIDIRNDMVTIRGNRRKDEEVTEDNYLYQECYWGPFSRTIILPEEINTDSSKALLKNGILTIRLPKLSKIERSKKVSVTET